MIDSHTHLNFPDFEGNMQDAISRAREAGVSLMLDVGTNIPSTEKSINISSKNSDIYSTAGLHPLYIDEIPTREELYDFLMEKGSHEKVVAIGETGLDFAKGKDKKEKQLEYLKIHHEVALKLEKPLIIHTRDADDACIDFIKKHNFPFGGILHCYTGGLRLAQVAMGKGFYISFSGIITYPKANEIREVAKRIPMDNILIETDAPFLAPQKYRGKRNEPAYVVEVGKKIAEIKGLSVEDVSRNVLHNFHRIFRIKENNPPTIVYKIRNSLYINLTNKCTNLCEFCSRVEDPYVQGYNLGVKKEPTAADIIHEMESYVSQGPDEVVFCGFGEPTIKLKELLEVAKYAKMKGFHVRLNTNGHGNMIHHRNICVELGEVVDSASISLNSATKDQYNVICQPADKEHAFDAVIDFIREAKKTIQKVTVSVVTYPDNPDKGECERLAKELDVSFRVREYNFVG